LEKSVFSCILPTFFGVGESAFREYKCPVLTGSFQFSGSFVPVFSSICPLLFVQLPNTAFNSLPLQEINKSLQRQEKR
jgi:hypothetical protein